MNARMGFLVLLLPTIVVAGSTPLQPRFAIENFHAPLVIDNPWWPLQPGTRTVLHELEDGECKVNDVVVTRTAKRDFHGNYAGLAARVVSDRVWSDPLCDGRRGLLLEDTADWYAQDNGGNVWYVGESTIEYVYDDAGHRIDSSTEGSWEAGRDGALAGIVMFRHPVEGQFYRQEYFAGEAEDEALNERVGIRLETKLGRFHDCLRTRETTPLSPGDYEFKYYCRNLGLVRVEAPVAHGGAELVFFGLR
jgi:hypothetical protein